MNLSAIFIRRPVTTTLLTLGILVFGAMSYGLLPLSDLPVVDFPTIQVTAGLPGASPETMASAVALPLEKTLSTIPGLTSINSTSSIGNTNIALQFDLSRNIDAAAQDVQAAIGRTSRSLPPNMPSPPTLQKTNPTDQAVISLVLQSTTLPMSVVDEHAQIVSQRLSTISGVAQISTLAPQKFAVRIDVDPAKLAARGIGIDEVATAIGSANVNLPTGTLYGDQNNFVLQVDGQLLNADAYKPVIVAYRGGTPVRLSDVAHVYPGVENDRFKSWYRGLPTIYLQVNKQPDANVVQVVEEVKKQLPALSAQLPSAISLTLRSDRSLTIRDSVRDVKATLLITIALVVLVIFLFLRNVSTTLIPSLALPTSLVATFSVMYLLSYSLDTLSLLALTLAVGFVVDDAIVMLENIVRHMEMGKEPMRAALDASGEVAFTILSMTVSLVAVFIPVLFMGGIVGRLLHEFAITISVAILVSGFVAISLIPMLCSRFLRPLRAVRHGSLYNATERLFDAWLRLYDRTLTMTLRFRALTMLASIVLVALTAYLYVQVPKGFLPTEDQGRFQLNMEGIQGLGFDEMFRHQKEVERIVAADPNVLAFASTVGVGTGTNQGQLYVDLKPRNERALSTDQLMAALRPKVAQVTGLRSFMINPPLINIGTRNARALYQFTLQDADTQTLYRWAPVMEERMKDIASIEDVNSDLLLRNPQLSVHLDRDKISAMGLTVNQVETAMFNAYGTRQVSQIYAPNNQYQVILGVSPQFQHSQSALSQLYVRSTAGRLVPIDSLATATTSAGPQSISHTGQLASVTIAFNVKPGVALGDAMAEIERVAANTLPAAVSTSFQGVAAAFQESLHGLGLVLIMALVVIYLVLGVLYESFTHPLTILSGLPSAGFGALLALLLFKSELNLYGFVGIIMLLGIVKKNGIMMVDFAVAAQREHGRTPIEAIHEACLVRFRPIMMTTMAALAGTLPIALGLGAGAETRRPLGLAVGGGLLVSQLLTLYITPVYYVYIENARLRLAGRRPPAPSPSRAA